jgi:acetate kinase
LALAGQVKILVLNGGSSSFKCWFGDFPSDRPLWTAHLGAVEAELDPALKSLLAEHPKIDAVGHRIVDGGPVYRSPTVLTPEVRAAIAKQGEFAPAHNRLELKAVETVDRVIGTDVPQIAVFDTGFHSTLEPAAYVYPGPYAWLEDGVRRYGFHGINHQYCAGRGAEMLGRHPDSLRLIICHLGNGASLAAVHGGKSVDTTMGFTPLEGLMMGTRSGSIDPEILVYLIRHRAYTAEQLDRVLNKESGLLGVSGLSSDMREIEKAMLAGNSRAQLAFDVYTHRLLREIGGMLTVLGGVDALIFTAGVGENSVPLRKIVCDRLTFLGLKLDPSKNAHPTLDQDIATTDSKVRVLLIRANEEWQIAKECHRSVTDA